MEILHTRILSEITGNQWAITPDALDGIIKAVDSGLTAADYALFHAAPKGDRDLLAADFGDRVDGTRKASVRGSVGILDVNGPIIPRADAFAESSGMTSIERLSSDLRALEADRRVENIVLVVDSPGGAIAGVSDFAKTVAASSKPTTAFVFGQASSAAYWIASAADRIVTADTGIVGSVGVVATVSTEKKKDRVEIVSAQSPKKRLGADTDEGVAELQTVVNAIGDVFVGAVATNRGVSVETVLEDFGQGGVLTPRDALAAGMVDGIDSFESLVGSFNTQTTGAAGLIGGRKMDLNTLKNEHPETFEAARAEGMTAERERVAAHLILGEASGDMDTARAAIESGDEMSALVSAKYQAASMRQAQLGARVEDNVEGNDLGTPAPAADTLENDVLAVVQAGLGIEGGA